MISLDKISLNFGGFDLFKEISFLINPKDRIGLIGKNGAGKTTLLKIIKGIDLPTSGNIGIPKNTTIGYLPQQMRLSDTRTLREETVLAFEELIKIQQKLARLNTEISEVHDYHSDLYLKKLDHINELNERFNILGGDNYEAELEQTLIGLGFERTDFNRSTSEFSGGWRMRVELAKLLLMKPDVFLLDEPTNHLDIESIQWLEDYLRDFQGALLLISHDRAFLDNVTNRTIELLLGRSYDYKVSYSKYVELRKERREQQLSAYRNQQKMIEDTEDFIERFRYKATKAVQVQSRIKQLAKVDRIEVDEEDTSTINIRFPTPIKSGKIVLEIKNLSKSYGPKNILDSIELTVESGQRIAFVGKNG
jgi:ATP-binding cassette subfamily F protein 3